MPKAPRKRNTTSRKEPIKSTKKDPKASHLYTDDNPSTTIHGTGFKDRIAAEKTLELISERSLTYQFQTVNTMFHRAKHHPAMKGGPTASNANMREAMDVFRSWLDITYPDAREGLKLSGFKPLLSKSCVETFLPSIGDEIGGEAYAFAKVYVGLAKGKRLGNILVSDQKPTEADWERKRYDTLTTLVGEHRETQAQWSADELWKEEGSRKVPTAQHLRLIAWAWSPIPEGRLKA